MTRERLKLCLLLAATFAIRAIHPDQPIVENYVGRQIPTAMVARNLERGSGFLHPQLDTGPFPNLFLVEPPIYAQLVAIVHQDLGCEWEPAGRLVSALATTLAAWGLFGLAGRREGVGVALLSVAAFAFFPVMIRFGRAFQPDALMLGCVLAGLRGWDEFEANGDRRWLVLGGFALSLGLALKATVAWSLIPFFLMVRRWPVAWRLAAGAAMLAPAFAWYLHAWGDLTRSASMASSDNAAHWIRSASPDAWLRLGTWESIARGLIHRSFTPVGFVLAGIGLLASGRVDRVWAGWGVGCALSVLFLAAKWHHSYYWMAVAPLAAVGVARGLARLARWNHCGRLMAVGLGSSFLVLCATQSASTWRTPVEWASLRESAKVVAALAPESSTGLIVAPEALIYYSDRRGLRLEFENEAMQRAAGEWGGTLTERTRSLDLVEFYERKLKEEAETGTFRKEPSNLDLIADVGPAPTNSRRGDFREAIRSKPNYRLLVDRPDLMIAKPD